MKQLNGNSFDYIKDAIKTESVDFEAIAERLKNPETIRLLHASMGIATEAGELLDNLKKYIFYGAKFDVTNLVEESGDLFWYLAILHDVLGKAFEYSMKLNIEKLKARYGDKFSEEGALNRDLEKERGILESDNEWRCKRCRYLNRPRLDYCVNCGEDR